MIVLTCRRCQGTGEIPNIQYEICQKMTSPAARQHFCIPGTEECHDAEEWVRMGCGHEKTLPCPVCGGEGILEFDEDEWELSVHEEDEGAGEEVQTGPASPGNEKEPGSGVPSGNVTAPP